MLCNCAKYTGIFRGRLEGMNDKPMIYREGRETRMIAVKPLSPDFFQNGFSNGDLSGRRSHGTLFDDKTLKTIKIKAPMEAICIFTEARENDATLIWQPCIKYSNKDGFCKHNKRHRKKIKIGKRR